MLRLPSGKIKPIWYRRGFQAGCSCQFKQAEGGREGFGTFEQCLNVIRCGFVLNKTGNWESYTQASLGLERSHLFCTAPPHSSVLAEGSGPQIHSPQKKPHTSSFPSYIPVPTSMCWGWILDSHQAWQNGNLLQRDFTLPGEKA